MIPPARTPSGENTAQRQFVRPDVIQANDRSGSQATVRIGSRHFVDQSSGCVLHAVHGVAIGNAVQRANAATDGHVMPDTPSRSRNGGANGTSPAPFTFRLILRKTFGRHGTSTRP